MPKIFSDRERQTIREKLLSAGKSALERKSYRSISVDEVTAEVGIAKGTFYHFFDSKEAFFYEIMQCIKEENRESLRTLFQNGRPRREEVEECLFRRYTRTQTAYDYFTPSEVKTILRKIPAEDLRDDSVEFAQMLGNGLEGMDESRAETVVGMFNILAMAAANRSQLELKGYEPAMRRFCAALAAEILGGEQ